MTVSPVLFLWGSRFLVVEAPAIIPTSVVDRDPDQGVPDGLGLDRALRIELSEAVVGRPFVDADDLGDLLGRCPRMLPDGVEEGRVVHVHPFRTTIRIGSSDVRTTGGVREPGTGNRRWGTGMGDWTVGFYRSGTGAARMADLRIQVDDVELEADWTGDNPETRAAIEDALPVEGDAARWGDELYFGTPVDVPEEDGQVEVPVGAVAYWPQGNALCLFWGPTPASTGTAPRAASAVNVVARIADTDPLSGIDGGASVRVEQA